jgi:Spy/CpxP family protein refolding chaperone
MNTVTRTLLLAVTLIFAGTAFAEGHGKDRRDHRGPPGMAMPAIEHLTRAFRHLDLSEEQKESIRTELKSMREEIKPLMKQMHESRKDLHGQITAESYDADAVAEMATLQGNLTAQITTITSGAAAGLLAQLTDEQRLELEAMGEKRRGHLKQRKERKKERPDGS